MGKLSSGHHGADEVYALAADMGGMGFISFHHAQILHNNALINLHTLEAARPTVSGDICIRRRPASIPSIGRWRRTSPRFGKRTPIRLSLKTPMAGRSLSPSGFVCITVRSMEWRPGSYAFITSLVRWELGRGGERRRRPRCVARWPMAKLSGNPEVEIWGDGEQTRSFCYIDDCVTGLYKLMQSDYGQPLNLGQDRLVTINQLADMMAAIAGIRIMKKHVPGPQGVRGRNSDNTRLRQVLGWEPEISLEEGLARTYAWIEAQVQKEASWPRGKRRRAERFNRLRAGHDNTTGKHSRSRGQCHQYGDGPFHHRGHGSRGESRTTSVSPESTA